MTNVSGKFGAMNGPSPRNQRTKNLNGSQTMTKVTSINFEDDRLSDEEQVLIEANDEFKIKDE